MLGHSAGSELALKDSKGQALHKQLPKAKTPHEQESLQRQIDATDKQIDGLVYELYGLTEEEIGIVRGGTE
jgi:predicted  nucleic acid-binding Zn-ribbon protein